MGFFPADWTLAGVNEGDSTFRVFLDLSAITLSAISLVKTAIRPR